VRFTYWIAGLAGVALLASETPKGLSSQDWSAIRTEYERHRHAAVPAAGGYQARNPGQQWTTHFDGRGFTVKPDGVQWTWGLELERYGFAGLERTVESARLTAANNQVRYERDGLEEWFLNDGRGLEQGFTLQRRPPGEGLLRLDLAVRGGLRASVTNEAVHFLDATGTAVLLYGGLKAWDADRKMLATRFELAGGRLRLTVDERGARYPVTVDPLAQQAYLKASNTGAGDEFGWSAVAVSGDTVVVGAHFEDSNATGVNGNQADNSAPDSGAAYVFTRTGGVWSQQAYLKASNTTAFDQFGFFVAVSGDTVVVSAPGEDSNATGVNGNQADNSAPDSGAAYVFTRSGGVWTQQAYLKASNTGGGDHFGPFVAVSRD